MKRSSPRTAALRQSLPNRTAATEPAEENRSNFRESSEQSHTRIRGAYPPVASTWRPSPVMHTVRAYEGKPKSCSNSTRREAAPPPRGARRCLLFLSAPRPRLVAPAAEATQLESPRRSAVRLYTTTPSPDARTSAIVRLGDFKKHRIYTELRQSAYGMCSRFAHHTLCDGNVAHFYESNSKCGVSAK